jgi:hypothetical protein
MALRCSQQHHTDTQAHTLRALPWRCSLGEMRIALASKAVRTAPSLLNDAMRTSVRQAAVIYSACMQRCGPSLSHAQTALQLRTNISPNPSVDKLSTAPLPPHTPYLAPPPRCRARASVASRWAATAESGCRSPRSPPPEGVPLGPAGPGCQGLCHQSF